MARRKRRAGNRAAPPSPTPIPPTPTESPTPTETPAVSTAGGGRARNFLVSAGRKAVGFLALIVLLVGFSLFYDLVTGELSPLQDAESTSGVKQAAVQVPVGPDGLTVEQRNVSQRLLLDNKPGSIKHLYVIAPKSGKCVLYSTVQSKLSSASKGLSPPYVQPSSKDDNHRNEFLIKFPDGDRYTTRVLGDDGTYGVSGEYVYWWDVRGVYHQHHLADGQIVHVSGEPVRFKSVETDLEASTNAPKSGNGKAGLHE